MFKYFVIISLLLSNLLASTTSESKINNVKILIAKEEYLALAINRYILEELKLPVKDGEFDIEDEKLIYLLGDKFKDFKNPFNDKNLQIEILPNQRVVVKSMVLDDVPYKQSENFVYNFYIDQNFRINTQAPISNKKEDLQKGTFIKYHSLQKKILEKIAKGERVQKVSSKCGSTGNFWQIEKNDLVYKYCDSNQNTINVYSSYPKYIEDNKQRDFIKGEIGDKIYTKDNYMGEFLFGIDGDGWSIVNRRNDRKNSDLCLEERILNYIPQAKDLVIRSNGGCMLANGDIFCWGDNSFKKAGIENYGQLDKNISADFINTPVMLKSDLENEANLDIVSKRWFNSPFRVKFEKMAMNSKMVCGISPIFESKATQKDNGSLEEDSCENIQNSSNQNSDDKIILNHAGNLYCNGDLPSGEYKMTSDVGAKSILRQNIEFAKNKDNNTLNSNAIFLLDIAMVEDAILLLSDDGKLFTIGKNTNGILGIASDDFDFYSSKSEVMPDKFFVSISATRDRRVFAALDDNDNLYIWGETLKETLTTPTLVSSSIRFSEDYILPQADTFVLRDNRGRFYYLNENNNISEISLNSGDERMTSATTYLNKNGSWQIAYINQNGELKTKEANSFATNCKNTDGTSCTGDDKTIFDDALDTLNKPSIEVGSKKYAWFKNISYFKPKIFSREQENFQNRVSNGWSGAFHDGKIRVKDGFLGLGTREDYVVEPFLGVFGKNHSTNNLKINTDGSQAISKEYLINDAKDKEITILIKIYELGSWDNEKFRIFINNNIAQEATFNNSNNDKLITVQEKSNVNNDIKMRLKEHVFEINSKTDINGRIEIGFGAIVDENWNNEGFGIADIQIIYDKEPSNPFICTITGARGLDQMYCWGDVARSLPIINTGAFDIDKIPSVNKLFINPRENLYDQMSFEKFDNSGNLFLKYPTYINSFDYSFKFK
ncbi:hypothetical protein EI285_04235 [Aliarcobacter skirrowii]|uniref:hypothetical protein n=1 Tax=Aliarcobacter skirrowii TaxID=28200 RepID=UPI000F675A45|nr:hypothetical protein [Aliarcobacter skirrowii]AZL53831.1 hypothetical protein EI285_04235 [Aliarcobacter skirrowii]